jgi:hypothetical protein
VILGPFRRTCGSCSRRPDPRMKLELKHEKKRAPRGNA